MVSVPATRTSWPANAAMPGAAGLGLVANWKEACGPEDAGPLESLHAASAAAAITRVTLPSRFIVNSRET
jgi:hypothetical protein